MSEETKKSFEIRCEAALRGLRTFWAEIAHMSDEDGRHLVAKRAQYAELAETLESGAGKALLARVEKETEELNVQGSTALMADMWSGGLEIAREAWGEDAVGFALEILKRERKSN